MKKNLIKCLLLFSTILLGSCSSGNQNLTKEGDLPRKATPEKLSQAMDSYLKAIDEIQMDIHSIMIVQDGSVLFEKWMSEGKKEEPHVLHSVSKTFTSTAVGLAIGEGKLNLSDKLVDFFPEYLPETVNDNLKAVTVRDLLTMNCGHDTDPTNVVRNQSEIPWAKAFLSYPFEHKPGTFYCYNSVGTYMLSAIVQKVTGEKVVDYLMPRLFEPLGIDKPKWEESPEGINCGGWGLYLKTEDLAKMGQLLLQKGMWNGKQLLPEGWVEEASKAQVPCQPAGMRPEQVAERGLTLESSDWIQGYGYQMWRGRHNSFRADGANGQYILVLPDLNATIAVTAKLGDMQKEISLIWEHILPALEK